jgi:hypothetical protein
MSKREIELTIGEEPGTAESDATESTDQADATDQLLSLVASGHALPADEAAVPARIAGLVLGRVVSARPLRVAWAGAPSGGEVRSLIPIEDGAIGRTAALMFEGHDPARPIVTGLVEPLPLPAEAPGAHPEDPRSVVEGLSVEMKGSKRRVVMSAEDELVLRCGKASITLTRAGKILIRGAYVSSTASGTHRIRGGSVEIN